MYVPKTKALTSYAGDLRLCLAYAKIRFSHGISRLPFQNDYSQIELVSSVCLALWDQRDHRIFQSINTLLVYRRSPFLWNKNVSCLYTPMKIDAICALLNI